MLRFIKMKLRIMMEDNFSWEFLKDLIIDCQKHKSCENDLMAQSLCYRPLALRNFSWAYRCSTFKYNCLLIICTLITVMMISDQDCENGSEASSSRSPTSYHEALALLSCRGLFRKRDIFTQTSRHSILGKLFVQLIDHESDISEPHFRN